MSCYGQLLNALSSWLSTKLYRARVATVLGATVLGATSLVQIAMSADGLVVPVLIGKLFIVLRFLDENRDIYGDIYGCDLFFAVCARRAACVRSRNPSRLKMLVT